MILNNPLVSVIIPCYNHGKYLDECITSIKNQSYSLIEIVLVNDGSTDNYTNSYIDQISDTQIKVIKKQNAGLSAARNTGIDNALGEFILPLDADDKIAPTYIELAVTKMMSDENIGVVFCKGKYFGTKNNLMESEYISFKSQMLYNGLFCSGVFRKHDFFHVGKYKTNLNRGYEDWDFWLRLLNFKNKVIQLDEVLFFYRQSETSMLTKLNNISSEKEKMELTVFNNNKELYYNQWGSMINILREYESLKATNISAQQAINEVHKSMSYRIGNFILSPLKFIRKLFK